MKLNSQIFARAACVLALSLGVACSDDSDTNDTDTTNNANNGGPDASSTNNDMPDADYSDQGSNDLGTPDSGDMPDMNTEGPEARCRDFGPLRAFPGAEGFGASSVGGRGGQVIYVTNLNDSGPGSLREAVDAEGPRTVVFEVGGTIELQTGLRIDNDKITIAGQTAPGGGIALKTAPSTTNPTMMTSANDIVLQHLRLRPGASTALANSVDALTVIAGERIMLANMSFSWAVDENVNFWYDAKDITIQDSIISEGLWHSTHDYGSDSPHSKGLISGPDNANMTILRNLFAHNDDRSPLIQSEHAYEILNNVIYNGYQVGTSLNIKATTRANVIGNVYLPGTNYRPTRYQIIIANVHPARVFVDDNISPRSEANDPWAAVGRSGIHDGGAYNGDPAPAEIRALTMFDMSEHSPVLVPANTLQDLLLPSVGASLPLRDAVDARIVQDVIDKTGELIDDPSDVGGWPTLASGSAPIDTDRDGMPDAWESARDLDPNDPADGNLDRDNDGYTNLEEYLACI